jgi:CysZ protein
MIRAYTRAIAQLGEPRMRRFVLISLGAALFVFIALWLALGFLIANTVLFDIWLIEAAVDFLGGLATAGLTWLLFPGVVGLVIGFLLEGVAAAVEARHFPKLAPARGLPLAASLGIAAKYLAILVVLNLALLVFLLTGPLFPFVFYAVNGYLLGREYFELVAMRRMGPVEMRRLRQDRRGAITMAGVVMAFLLTVPVVNLLTPIIVTSAMVHLFQGWRGQDEDQMEGRVEG